MIYCTNHHEIVLPKYIKLYYVCDLPLRGSDN